MMNHYLKQYKTYQLSMNKEPTILQLYLIWLRTKLSQTNNSLKSFILKKTLQQNLKVLKFNGKEEIFALNKLKRNKKIKKLDNKE